MKKLVLFLIVINFIFVSISSVAEIEEDANSLFDWAEVQYPEYFSPSGPSTQNLGSWIYRFYTDTQVYIAVNGQDSGFIAGGVYLLGGEFGDTPVYAGLLGTLLLATRVEGCPDVSGSWTVTEEITLTSTVLGNSDTIFDTDTDTIEMIQDGCSVQYFRTVTSPAGGTVQVERAGTLNGDSVTFSGIAAIPVSGASCSKNSIVIVGTIDINRIYATTSVDIQCTYLGTVETVTGSGTAIFTRPLIIEIINSGTLISGFPYFDNPSGIALDSSNNVYVTTKTPSNVYSYKVIKITPDSTSTVLVELHGDEFLGDASALSNIAIDSSGNVYLPGGHSHKAFKISPDGTSTEIIDSAGDGLGSTLNNPYLIALDSLDNVYVSGSPSKVFKITPDGNITEIIDSSGDGLNSEVRFHTRFDLPTGIVADSSGNVYVSGYDSHNAFKITPDGTITEIIDSEGDGLGNVLDQPYGVATDSLGNVYVIGRNSHNAFKITPDGVITLIIDASGDGVENDLNAPYAITVDSLNNVYVSGHGSDNAFKITPDGTITEIIDFSADGLGLSSDIKFRNRLDRPNGITVDSAGNVYLVGEGSMNVFKIRVSE